MAYTHEQRITRLEEKCKGVNDRLTKVEETNKAISDINLNIKELAVTQKGMLETMKSEQDIRKKHEERLDNLEKKPAANAEKLKWIVITAIVSAIVSGAAGALITFFSTH